MVGTVAPAWNSLLHELRSARTIATFKCQLKAHLFTIDFLSNNFNAPMFLCSCSRRPTNYLMMMMMMLLSWKQILMSRVGISWELLYSWYTSDIDMVVIADSEEELTRKLNR